MKRFKLSPEAAADVREIWEYIARDSPRAARRVRLQLFDACKLLATNPHLGHPREDLTSKPVLFWPTGSYLVIYRVAGRTLEIVRIVHAARDVARLN